VLGVATLAPAVVTSTAGPLALAVGFGAVLFAGGALRAVTHGIVSLLAAAIAFADNAIADEENETLNAFAEGLGIDESRANELLDDVEKDMSQEG
jgi:spermidine/putrescine-binding protein